MRICSVEGCGKKHCGKSFCQTHYRRHANPEAAQLDRERVRRYREAHPEEARKSRYTYRRKNPERIMWYNAKRRAPELGVDFNIEISDIVIPERCPILGMLLRIGDVSNLDCSPSLDRIRPDIGYVKGNIAVISMRANRIKHNATFEEITKLQQWMSQFQ